MAMTLEEKRAANKAWRTKNPEKFKAQQERWRAKSKDKIRLYHQRYVNKHAIEIAEKRRAVKAAVREFIDTYKSSRGCLRCGEMEVVALDIHHIDRKSKEFKLSIGSVIAIGIESAKVEMEKCIVLCASCHRKLHAGVISIPGIPCPGPWGGRNKKNAE